MRVCLGGVSNTEKAGSYQLGGHDPHGGCVRDAGQLQEDGRVDSNLLMALGKFAETEKGKEEVWGDTGDERYTKVASYPGLPSQLFFFAAVEKKWGLFFTAMKKAGLGTRLKYS